jgi:hypothetical protein
MPFMHRATPLGLRICLTSPSVRTPICPVWVDASPLQPTSTLPRIFRNSRNAHLQDKLRAHPKLAEQGTWLP